MEANTVITLTNLASIIAAVGALGTAVFGLVVLNKVATKTPRAEWRGWSMASQASLDSDDRGGPFGSRSRCSHTCSQ